MMIDPVGTYDAAGYPLAVEGVGDPWSVRLPGAPAGFEPELRRLDDTTFQMIRGPFADAVVSLHEDGNGEVGPIPLTRVDGPYAEPPGYGLAPPPITQDEERDRRFADLLASTPDGGRIRWDGDGDKAEFVRWAIGLDEYIFHGSNNQDIEEFVPVRTSVELRDHGGKGNVGAVYGTHDGLWSMFFAVVDRSSLVGSIRNGVSSWEAADGRTTETYQFSIHYECLPDEPFTTGALYLLPRQSFRRLPFYPGGPPSPEWVSESPVLPRASLIIGRSDFPFEIGGHDDSALLEMYRLFGAFTERVTSGDRTEDTTILLTVDWDDETASLFGDWTRAVADFLPDVTMDVTVESGQAVVTIVGPSALIDDVEKSVA